VGPQVADLGGGSYGLFLLETLLILVLVCVVAYVVMRFGLRRFYGGGSGSAAGPVRVLQRIPLEPRRTMYVIQAAGKTLLVAASEGGGMTLISELDTLAVQAELALVPRQRSFLEILTAQKKTRGGP
jgi:flagellar protein FliO/FliZ